MKDDNFLGANGIQQLDSERKCETAIRLSVIDTYIISEISFSKSRFFSGNWEIQFYQKLKTDTICKLSIQLSVSVKKKANGQKLLLADQT